MMDSNSLSRLLAAQPLAASNMQMTPPPQTQAAPMTVAQVTTSEAERRRQEIAKREEERQRKAREKLANRQAQMQPEVQEQAESDVSGSDFTPMDAFGSDYGIEDLVSGARGQAEDRMGELDRKPISEWSKGDWGKLLVDIGGGFANAQDGSFAAGLAGGTKGAASHLQRLDDRAQKWDDKQRSRVDDLDDLLMRDSIQRRQVLDERGYRSGERQLDRVYEQDRADARRAQELQDRDEQRAYLQGAKADERAYAERATAAANQREDAKALRDAAAKNSRNYSEDYLKMATELIKGTTEAGNPPPTSEDLDKIIIPQLQRAYGISGTLGSPESGNMLPANRTLSSGY